jgi:hypothetical protein
MILADEFREHCQRHMLTKLENIIYEGYPEIIWGELLTKQVNVKK